MFFWGTTMALKSAQLGNDSIPESMNDSRHPAIAKALEILERQSAIWQSVTADPSHSQISLQWKSQILGWHLTTLLEPVLP